MKSAILLTLVAPALSQFCFNSEPVNICVQEAQSQLMNCGGNPQCACTESQHLSSCYQGCANDPNYFQQMGMVNSHIAQYCGAGMGGFGTPIGPMGAFPSAFPGWRGPSVNSVNVNSGLLEATATFRTGNFNSRSFRNSGNLVTPSAILLPIAILSAIMLF